MIGDDHPVRPVRDRAPLPSGPILATVNTSQRGADAPIVTVSGMPAAPARQLSYRSWLIALVVIGLVLGLLVAFVGEFGENRPAI